MHACLILSASATAVLFQSLSDSTDSRCLSADLSYEVIVFIFYEVESIATMSQQIFFTPCRIETAPTVCGSLSIRDRYRRFT